MNQRGFFFPIAMIISTIFLMAAVELTYLAKVQTDVVENLQTQMNLYYASQAGSEIIQAWHDVDENFGFEATTSNFSERELYRFNSRYGIQTKLLLMQDRVWLLNASRRALFFASTSQIDNPRFKKLKRIETSYGFYYFVGDDCRWFELYR